MASIKMVLMMKAFLLFCLFAFPETKARTLPELRVSFKSKIIENAHLMIITSYEKILSKPYSSKGETAVSDFGGRGASPPPPPIPATPQHPGLVASIENEGLDLRHSSS
ncbi:hypothetical protein LguiA_034018 [Lonicera macranthoides]